MISSSKEIKTGEMQDLIQQKSKEVYENAIADAMQDKLDSLRQQSKDMFDNEFKMYAKRGFSYYSQYGEGFFSIQNRLFKHKFGPTCIILNELFQIRDLLDFLYWQGTNPLFRRDLSLEGDLNLINLSADIERFKTSHIKLSRQSIRDV